MTISDYLNKINIRFKTGISREHSYRGDLQTLLESIAKDVLVTNEPARIACGAPDYIITRKDIPVGYIEAKDLGKSLNSKDYKEQFDRYKTSLNNLIITDYLDFWLFKDGELVTSIKVGEIQNGEIKPLPENFSTFESLVKDFCQFTGVTLKSPAKLAVMMADKAKFMAQIIEKALTEDSNYQNQTLHDQMQAFKDILIHDIKPREFADIYAQTVAYGMFAARLHDPTLPTFSRQEAAELIPRTNPFLRKLFSYIAGPDIDDRIKWIVDALADVFRATDILALLTNFGKATQTQDPIIHFYETFLSEYDPALRKARGVWYTPEPAVKFIVRAVDDILQTEFELPKGLADTSKTKITLKVPTHDKRYTAGMRDFEQEVHKVQILDPATGTGTFLAEVVKYIYGKNFAAMQGAWGGYVENHLIPRLNGFELLMASYSMAHLKLDMLLRNTGYQAKKEQRFRIYLTNSLEEHHKDTGSLFANWLSSEANEANQIKRDTPVMIVMGNPPYSVSSSNKSPWIQNLIADYKVGLKERKINLDDDYIKFIRYAEHLVEKTGQGIVAMITNNSFIDGITHRQMRKHLLETFDKIYVLDLHGSAKKNEVGPDGTKDENVFDIQQGVAISIFIKKSNSKTHSEVLHNDLFGKREFKYDELKGGSVIDLKWNKLTPQAPNYFFVVKDFSLLDDYNQGFGVTELFRSYNSGVQTKRDALTINFDLETLNTKVSDFKSLDVESLRIKYNLPEDGRDWRIEWAKADIKNNSPKTIKIFYRPFDNRYTLHSGKSKGFIAYPREPYTNYFTYKNNINLVLCRQLSTFDFQHCFVSNVISDLNSISLQTKEQSYQFPLYSYLENKYQTRIDGLKIECTPNFNQEILNAIANKLNIPFINEKKTKGEFCSSNSELVCSELKQNFAPIDLLDYIYAILHSPAYREKYKEFLKIDFPRVPYPSDADTFWQLVKLGGQLRRLHLLESEEIENYITTYPKDGSNTITRKTAQKDWELYDAENGLGRIWINEEQYFDKIPLNAWKFYIGGYQPAQKWLKDRVGRELSFDDILHYQKIIVALARTAELMEEIDKVFVFEAA